VISVKDALDLILNTISIHTPEAVDLYEALGRVLAEPIQAHQDLPPFANSAMDGFAVVAADVQSASSVHPVRLRVIEDIAAGGVPGHTLHSGQAARIMTGAPVPAGADAIVPVEMTDLPLEARYAPTPPAEVAILESVSPGAYIRREGEDIRAGEMVLAKGHRLRPADLGALAGLGFASVEVVRQPRVAILSTGDELITPETPLSPGKIRDMNSYTLSALIQQAGAIPVHLGIARDTESAVEAKLEQAIAQKVDLILSSAGVSVGAFDVVRPVLERLGQIKIWQVNMRPGKPLTFGQVAGIPFLGLPGNPVSSMVTFYVFVRPILQKMLGLPWEMPLQQATAAETITSDGRLTFVRVRLKHDGKRWMASLTGTQSSGAISSLVKADGLLVIPAGVTRLEAGSQAEVYFLSEK
jgi:molybdopterin molybdotransferase